MILIIYGAGGLAKETYDIAMNDAAQRSWDKVYFVDDFAEEGEYLGREKLHFETITRMYENRTDELEGVVAVGEPSSRQLLAEKMTNAGIRLATLIHKKAYVSSLAQLGAGTVVFEFADIHANVHIGDNCLIEPFALISHDTRIGNSSVVSAHCSQGGALKVGERAFFGLSSSVKEKLTIGDDAIVGMGAVVVKDVENGQTVVGNPARVTKGNEAHKVFA